MTEAIPAPTWTDGPSRPSAIPVARDTEQSPNFPKTVRRLIRPSRRNSAAFVCGIPLPRAFGKYLNSSGPVTSAPSTGSTRRLQGAPPAGYIRAPRFSVNTMNATTTKPTTAPMIRVNRRRIRSS